MCTNAVTSARSKTAWPYRNVVPTAPIRKCVYQSDSAVTINASVTEIEATKSWVRSAENQLKIAPRKTPRAIETRPMYTQRSRVRSGGTAPSAGTRRHGEARRSGAAVAVISLRKIGNGPVLHNASPARAAGNRGRCARPLLHRVDHVEDRQVHRDDHATDDHAEDHDHHRLHEGEQRLDRRVHLLVVEVGDLGEHLVQAAGLLAHRDHRDHHRRGGPGLR